VCPVALFNHDIATAERAVAMLIDLAARYQLSFWSLVGRGLDGQLRIARGEFAAGVGLLRPLLQNLRRPDLLGTLAEGLGGIGEYAEALTTLEEGLALAEQEGELWCAPELLRIKGELLLRQAADRSIAAADHCFRRALKLAAVQGALFWELRAAASLARLRVDQARADEARQILAPVYARFTEGFGTANLKDAKALLDALG